MMSRDLWMVQDNGIIGQTSQSKFTSAQRNRTNLRHDILRCATAVIIGKCHKRTMLIRNTEEIPVCQYVAELLIACNLTPLIINTIERLSSTRMRMHEDQLIPLS